MRQVVFCALLSAGVSLGRNFAEFQKMRVRVCLLNLPLLGFTGTLGAAVYCKMLCYVGISSAF